MSFQTKVAPFTINTQGTFRGSTEVFFDGTSIVNNEVAVSIMAIEMSYGSDEDHELRDLNIKPEITSVSGNSAQVTLTATLGDNSDNYMSGSIYILAMANVNK